MNNSTIITGERKGTGIKESESERLRVTVKWKVKVTGNNTKWEENRRVKKIREWKKKRLREWITIAQNERQIKVRV